jgi:hypothetical protein
MLIVRVPMPMVVMVWFAFAMEASWWFGVFGAFVAVRFE